VRRLFFFIVKLTLVVAVAAWLASRPGTAHIVWHGYEIETSASILAVLLSRMGSRHGGSSAISST